jgi:hypothetical protein
MRSRPLPAACLVLFPLLFIVLAGSAAGSAARSRRSDAAYRRGRDQGVSGFGCSSPSTQMSARSL